MKNVDMLAKNYIVTMSDGSRWTVPIMYIAMNHAEYFAFEFDNDVMRSLEEGTIPLFTADTYEIHDWAAGNMDWCDVVGVASPAAPPVQGVDYDDGWMNGAWDVV